MGIELGRGTTASFYIDEFIGDALNTIPIGRTNKNLRSYIFGKPFASNFLRTDYESKLDELLVYPLKRYIHECDSPLRYNEKVNCLVEKNIPNAYYTFKYNFKPTDIFRLN